MVSSVCCLWQEHTLARAIHAIQAALWPGGTWFMYRPEYPRLKVRLFPIVIARSLGAAAAASQGSSRQWASIVALQHLGTAEGGILAELEDADVHWRLRPCNASAC